VRTLIDTFIRDAIEASEQRLNDLAVKAPEDVTHSSAPIMGFSPAMKEKTVELSRFLYTGFYTHHRILRMQFKAGRLLRDLFTEYVHRPQQLPPGVSKRLALGTEPAERIVCDYIAGMTDRFALDEHRKLFLPYEY
jgi:dGTPase